MNDPNALWRDAQGRWQLLYQHRDDAPHWRRTHWGRLVSDDLLHWRPASVALAAAGDRDRYSGCVVTTADGPRAYSTEHRSGPPRHERVLLHALDAEGTLGPGEGVLDEGRGDFRDPFVFQARGRWWLLLAEPCGWDAPATGEDGLSGLRCWSSADGRDWKPADWLGPEPPHPRLMWEVPQMLPLAALGASADERWLLLLSELDRRGGHTRCAVRWHLVRPTDEGWAVEPGAGRLLDHGPDCYATALHTPACEGEPPLLLAWMSSWAWARRLPLEGFAGGPMTLPRQLRWNGHTLSQQALATPGAAPQMRWTLRLGEAPRCLAAQALALDVQLRLEFDETARLEIGLGGFDECHPRVHIGGRPRRLELLRPSVPGSTLDEACGWAGRWAAVLSTPGQVTLRLVLDACCLELFADDGALVMSALVPPAEGGLWLRARGGGVSLGAGPAASPAAATTAARRP